MVQARSPKELRAWILAKCDAIARAPGAKRSALLHRGPFKEFYEEIFAFSIFAMRSYGHRDDVLCVPNRDEGLDFDTEVRDSSRTLRVEITLARQPKWHDCIAYLLEYGYLYLSMWESSIESREYHLRLVKAAAEQKAGRGRYGRGYELVIAVEDSWFDADRDSVAVDHFLEHEVATLPLCMWSAGPMNSTSRW